MARPSQDTLAALLAQIVFAYDALINAELIGKPDLIEAARRLSHLVEEAAIITGTSRSTM